MTITLASGRRITSTPDHVHFAGFVVGRTPQQHMVYVMWKAGVGFRIGASRTYTDGQPKNFLGPVQRCHQERADAMWVISTHTTEAATPGGKRRTSALATGFRPSPSSPGIPEHAGTTNLVGNQMLLDKLFQELDTEKKGRLLLGHRGLTFEYPHHVPATSTAARSGRTRRRLSVVLCGDRRGRSTIIGSRCSATTRLVAEQALETLG